MTVGQLIKYLKQYSEDTKVVVKDTDKNSYCLDFVEIDTKKSGIVNARPLENQGPAPRKVYEAKSKGSVQVLTLNSKPKVY